MSSPREDRPLEFEWRHRSDAGPDHVASWIELAGASYFLIVIAACVSGIDYFGGVAVSEVPPLVDLGSENGRTTCTPGMITRSGEVFH